MNLSITIIGHNEVKHLRELIPQLKWAKEIVYVDCESQDGSKEFAKNAGCCVFSRPNNKNLNVNKSFDSFINPNDVRVQVCKKEK